ncbi:carbon catabolite repression protein cred [Saccharata proteae CBS 121410]|uniref:Carbon catabolite repression protein cred n=1 Tax=Saccharata proteae CBS 121410 TaxID=1314787 RepID=A0A9P4M201_9PEZI|nr:carbon catabolite repression protein cred [Saccharata proteae CBS 121410]
MVATPKVFGGSKHKPRLEIKPDSPFVVFQGDAHNAEDVEIAGKLVLTCRDSVPIRCIKLSLIGSRKVSWLTNAVNPQQIVHKQEFLRENKTVFPTESSTKKVVHHMGAGTHEWNFKFTLKGNMPESVEGLAGSYIVYNLHAVLDRGMMNKALYADKHMRVIRTLSSEILGDTAMEQTNEDVWADKICYKITIPQTNFIFGTQATADFQLIPLRKGVTIGTIKMELHEHVVLHAQQGERVIPHSWDAIVAKEEFEMPDTAEQRMTEQDEDHPFDESYKFKLTLPFPKSLKKCRQNVDTDCFRIDHKIKLYVNLHNPEGHTSQLLVKNNCVLFISPNLPVNEDQTVSAAVSDELVEQAMHAEATQAAPPMYAEHQLDQMYSGIDPSGFRTPGAWHGSPGQSGYATPFYTQSRRNSFENIPSSIDAVAETEGAGASAQQLHSRLARLSMTQNGMTRNPSYNSAHSSGTNTPYLGQSAPNSSYFPPVPDIHTEDYDMTALSRIPSYNTAMRTPIRTPISEDLPDYNTAISRPSSPTLQRPVQAHTTRNSGSTTPSPTGSLETLSEETQRNTVFNPTSTMTAATKTTAGAGDDPGGESVL